MKPGIPTFFATPAALRAWLQAHHAGQTELWVGFHKRATGEPSITWPESVDQALCFGWIDGVRRSLGETSYMIRFTPRRPRSLWSRVNLKRMAELEAAGLVHPAGRQAFAARSGERSGVYSYEQEERPRLTAEYEQELRSRPGAWKDLESRPPWYQRAAVHWVMSAKKEETRRKRLATLADCAEAGKPIPMLDRPTGKR